METYFCGGHRNLSQEIGQIQRKSWDSIFMEMCFTIAQRSTCAKLKTASVIQRNNVVISIGYNGSVAKALHCNEYWLSYYYTHHTTDYETSKEFLKSDLFYEEHHKWSVFNELHGEQNAILQAGKNGISLEGSTLYTIYSPCIGCAKCIISAGIKKVYYDRIYNRDTSGIEFLEKNHIKCKKL
jgi:dCMP deaminase